MYTRDPDFKFILNQSNVTNENSNKLTELLRERKHLKPLAAGIRKLLLHNRFSKEYFVLLINHAEDAESLAEAINYLHIDRLISLADQKNLDLLQENIWRIKKLAIAMKSLSEASLLNKHYLKLFVDIEVQESVFKGIEVLSLAEMLDEKYFSLILQHPKDAHAIALGLAGIHKADISITTELCNSLIAAGADAHTLAQGFVTLNANGMYKLFYIGELLAAPQNAAVLAEGIVYLRNHQLLEVEEYLNALLKCSTNANYFAKLMDVLNQNKLLKTDNITLLLTDKKHYPSILKAIEKLIAADCFNQTSFVTLLKNPEMSILVADGIIHLRKANLATAENCLALGEYSQAIHSIVTVLDALAKGEILNEPNHTALMQNIAHVRELGSAVIFFNPLNQKAYARLLANPRDAINFAKRSVGLPVFAEAQTNLYPPRRPPRPSEEVLQQARARAASISRR